LEPQSENPPKSLAKKSVLSLRDWVILLSLASVQFVNILDFIIVMPLGPRFFDELGLSAEQFGYVVASYGYASSVAGIVAAGWINRIERRKALLVILFLFLLSSLACYLSGRFTSLILARCMTGVCGGLIGSMVMSIASDLYAESRRGYALGVIMTSFSMASVVGVPIGLWLAERDSSARTPFLYLALVCIPIWILLCSFLPRVPSHKDSGDHGYWGTFWGVLKSPSHRWAFLFTCILVFQTFLIVPFLATYVVKNAGLPEEYLQFVYIVGGAFTFVTMPLVGKLSDRFGKPLIYKIVVFLAVVPAVVITHLPPVAAWLCVLVTTTYMVMTSARMVPAQAMISSLSQPQWRTAFLSISSSVQSLAIGVAASISANIVVENAQGKLENFWIAGWVGVFFFIGSLFLIPKIASLRTD